MLGEKIMVLTSFVSDNMPFLTQSVRKKLSKQRIILLSHIYYDFLNQNVIKNMKTDKALLKQSYMRYSLFQIDIVIFHYPVHWPRSVQKSVFK